MEEEEDAVLRREGGGGEGWGEAKVEDGTKTDVGSLSSLADRWQRLRPIPPDCVCVSSPQMMGNSCDRGTVSSVCLSCDRPVIPASCRMFPQLCPERESPALTASPPALGFLHPRGRFSWGGGGCMKVCPRLLRSAACLRRASPPAAGT